MEAADRRAWLYVRGHESIRIVRDVAGQVLVVCGPGQAAHTRRFDNAANLRDALQWSLRLLEQDGWVLLDTSDRRERVSSPQPERRRVL